MRIAVRFLREGTDRRAKQGPGYVALDIRPADVADSSKLNALPLPALGLSHADGLTALVVATVWTGMMRQPWRMALRAGRKADGVQVEMAAPVPLSGFRVLPFRNWWHKFP